MMMGYAMEGPLSWLGFGMSMIVHLAFVVLILLSVVWMFQAVLAGKRSDRKPDSLEILKFRYAKGEINGEEYQRLKQELA